MNRTVQSGLKGLALACVFAVAGFTAPTVTGAASLDPSIGVQVNDQVVSFPDAKPFVDAGSQLQVPLRFVSERLGYNVNWSMDGPQVNVTLTKNDKTVHLTTGRKTVQVNGSPFDLDTEAAFDNGRVYVPLRFLADTSATPIHWDNDSRTAILNTDGKNHASARQVPYTKMLTVNATAYSDSPAENGGYGSLDYMGNQLQLGTVAVDPSVIPLGSKLYIEGYNFDGLPVGGMMAEATDVGGAIKGDRIDIFIPGSPDYLQSFGIQQVKVYLMK